MGLTDEQWEVLAPLIEKAGFASYYVPEHGHIPTKREAAHPRTGDETLPDERYMRTLDPWTSLASAAAVTRARTRLASLGQRRNAVPPTITASTPPATALTCIS